MGSGLSQEEPVEEEIVSEAHAAALYIHGFVPHSKFDEFEEVDVLVASFIKRAKARLPSGVTVTASAILATGR